MMRHEKFRPGYARNGSLLLTETTKGRTPFCNSMVTRHTEALRNEFDSSHPHKRRPKDGSQQRILVSMIVNSSGSLSCAAARPATSYEWPTMAEPFAVGAKRVGLAALGPNGSRRVLTVQCELVSVTPTPICYHAARSPCHSVGAAARFGLNLILRFSFFR